MFSGNYLVSRIRIFENIWLLGRYIEMGYGERGDYEECVSVYLYLKIIIWVYINEYMRNESE